MTEPKRCQTCRHWWGGQLRCSKIRPINDDDYDKSRDILRATKQTAWIDGADSTGTDLYLHCEPDFCCSLWQAYPEMARGK
jgi:hypothetical protein